MEVINIQKHYVKSIQTYQTGFIIELENWVNPEVILKDINTNSDSDDTIKNCRIQYRMNPAGEMFTSLYILDMDRIDF